MYRIEGSGGVIRNCWQLIIIPKYINRGYRTQNFRNHIVSTLALQHAEGPVVQVGKVILVTCAGKGETWHPRLHWHWEPVQKQWRFNWSAVNKSAECVTVQADLLGIVVNILLYCVYYCRLRTGFCHFAPLWWLARLCCRSVPGFSPKILLLLLEYILLTSLFKSIFIQFLSQLPYTTYLNKKRNTQI